MLTKRGLITPEQLEEALFAQKQFGGKLGTNLVELGYITDDDLAICLSEQLSVPYVKAQALGSVPRDVVARLPRNMAEKYRVVPLRYHGGELHVALADPHNFARVDELAFALGVRLRPYVVTEVVLNYALERYYNIRREARLMQAATDGIRELASSAPPRVLRDVTPAALQVFDSGPVQTTTVVDELAAVMSEEDLVRVFFRYFSELFVEVIVLSVAGGRAKPMRAGSRSRTTEARQPAPVSMAEGTLLRAVIGKPQIIHQPQVTDHEVARLCTAYGLPTTNVAFISLFNGDAPAYTIIGQGRDERYLLQAFAGLKSFVGKASHALRIVALRNEIRAA